ncbi:MAG: nitronate monooxygenase family protein [Candidatus Izemoplasma sp.]|nr:nitronate monooxygenase family protein [Candidatus Izemoplasma sp.]
MKLPSLTINNKTVKYPIIQGGMGIRISLKKLARACMDSGIIATISSAQIGQLKKGFKDNPLQINKEALKEEIDAIRATNPDGILGVNVMHAINHYDAYCKFLSTQDIDFIISGAGLPTDLPEYIKNSKVKGAFIISSARAAKIMLKKWDRNYQFMPAFIVCEGPLAGGHLGFSKADFDAGKVPSLHTIVKETKEVVTQFEQKYDVTIPVIAAGGIHDGIDMAKALSSGSDGVQVATRFIATEECDVNHAYKTEIVNAKEDDIVRVDSPAGLPGRAIKNHLTNFLKRQNMRVSYCVDCLKSCAKKDIPFCITEQLGKSADGDTDGLLFTGAKAYLIDKIETVEEVVQSLISGCKLELQKQGGM